LDRSTAVPHWVRLPVCRRSAQPDDAALGSLSDAELALHAGNGPEIERDRAFDLLFHRYVDAVHGYAFRRLGSREAAEDATSDVFHAIARALPCYRPRPDASFRSWLFAIAHNVIVDHRARQQRDRDVRRLDPLAAELFDPAPSPADLAAAADEGRWIRSLLVVLPSRERQVLELDLAGLKTAEIADVLGLSSGAVHTARSRALAHLRAYFAADPATTEALHATAAS
jgi:RNA polymerase sigma-70 factor (ECF subfamily)